MSQSYGCIWDQNSQRIQFSCKQDGLAAFSCCPSDKCFDVEFGEEDHPPLFNYKSFALKGLLGYICDQISGSGASIVKYISWEDDYRRARLKIWERVCHIEMWQIRCLFSFYAWVLLGCSLSVIDSPLVLHWVSSCASSFFEWRNASRSFCLTAVGGLLTLCLTCLFWAC